MFKRVLTLILVVGGIGLAGCCGSNPCGNPCGSSCAAPSSAPVYKSPCSGCPAPGTVVAQAPSGY